MKRSLLLFILLICPAIAFAAIFDVPPTDKSMHYLGMIFGPVAGLPIQATGNAFFGVLLGIFNQIVFVLGICIIAYTTVVGAIHTAHEGKFLGEKWHSILVPLRAAVGLYLLLPSSSGYNWIQVCVLWFIVQGVGAANALWTQMMFANQYQGNINQDTREQDLDDTQTTDTVNGIFKADLCMDAINNNQEAMGILGEPIRAFRFGDEIYFSRASLAGSEEPTCGSIDLAAPAKAMSGSDVDIETRKNVIADAILLAVASLQPNADEALTKNPKDYTLASTYLSSVRVLQSAVLQLSHTTEDLSDKRQKAIDDGWIMAGAYYFQLVKGGRHQTFSASFPASQYDNDQMDALLGATIGTAVRSKIDGVYDTYVNYATDVSSTSAKGAGGQLQIVTSKSNNKWIQKVFNALFGGMSKTIIKAMTKAMTKSKTDPLISMATFGNNILIATEVTFWAALVAVFTLWLAASGASCIQPLPHSLNGLLSMMLPIAFILIAILWTSGVLLGIYAPLIPFLVFSFAALGWMILVIEAMLGAPLIALTLVIPSEDEIGKAGHAIIILLSLFLRPALMVLGFIIAIKLLTVAIDMLNFGFFATLKSSGGATTGLFGVVSVIFLYTSLCISILNEAFSLIYVLPNKILRWMGGGAEGEEVGGMVKEARQTAESGAEMGGGMMKGALSHGGGMVDQAKKDKKSAGAKKQGGA